MGYKKLTVELVVDADEADVVVNRLDDALDQLDEDHTIYGGHIEAAVFNLPSKRRRSALGHTLAAVKRQPTGDVVTLRLAVSIVCCVSCHELLQAEDGRRVSE